MSYFVQALKAIAKVLIQDEAPPADNESTEEIAIKTPMTMFGLNDFIISADDLFETDDLTAEQYTTLVNAIFSQHPSVQSLFDLYHNPDFILACDADAGLRANLCLRDLLHLGRKLEPIQPQSQHDEKLKWAIKTGIHNFSALLSTELPKDFVKVSCAC